MQSVFVITLNPELICSFIERYSIPIKETLTVVTTACTMLPCLGLPVSEQSTCLRHVFKMESIYVFDILKLF